MDYKSHVLWVYEPTETEHPCNHDSDFKCYLKNIKNKCSLIEKRFHTQNAKLIEDETNTIHYFFDGTFIYFVDCENKFDESKCKCEKCQILKITDLNDILTHLTTMWPDVCGNTRKDTYSVVEVRKILLKRHFPTYTKETQDITEENSFEVLQQVTKLFQKQQIKQKYWNRRACFHQKIQC